ncbi:hypothetical protein [Rathayibacter rathayi]|uniref:Uncharacterized protein n=2 Tax=Rathayibacter rathayi TaxID=33887 RepID=A0ABX5A7V7_RATRA|nr:hypothetical protein [Rathayibacter rathayi]MWV76046.1 hypothetical protein [Rathayibacter rathayi NCPPB 2980 = VKM Ac-1601]PPG65151.1 hypothetical protein C5C16_13620 [Rathayibacter rathayi]PPG74208.1 hypothetical protein C5C15_15255 [Rathayibacter rathayi]PPG87535.1 hypothetical protein C5C47_10165 [Rathayibacter rathayi]PPG95107.1 hypothetical protein C5C00_10835 [Rathayibacter rathayi]
MIVDQATAAAWSEISETDMNAMYEEWESRDLTDPLREVEILLGQICQGMEASSWSSEIDRDAWVLLRNPEHRREEEASENHPYCSGPELAQMLERLEELTISRGWFPIYDLGLDAFHARIASLEVATRIFALRLTEGTLGERTKPFQVVST